MTFEIKDYFETPVILEPRVELYTVYDFMGKELPGLATVSYTHLDVYKRQPHRAVGYRQRPTAGLY